MPVINYGTTDITTYNDVAGNQVNNSTYTFSKSLVFLHGPSITQKSAFAQALPFSLPTKEPYATFLDLIVHIQTTLHPIEMIVDEAHLFSSLNEELSGVLVTTALLGRLVETVDSTLLEALVWHRRIADRVRRYTGLLRVVSTEIHRYRDGLKQTIIGPIWRRVLWSAIWNMGYDSNITRILATIQTELEMFKKPLERLIFFYASIDWRQHNINVQELETLRGHARSHFPMYQSVHLLWITAASYTGYSVSIPLDRFATSMDVIYILHTALQINAVGDWVDSSDHKVLSPAKFSTLSCRTPSHSHTHLLPLVQVAPMMVYEDRDDICFRCLNPTTGKDWKHCGKCGLRAMIVDVAASPLGTSANIRDFSQPYLFGRSAGHIDTNVQYAGARRLQHLWSHLSSLTEIKGLEGSPETMVSFLGCLGRMDSPIQNCQLKVSAFISNILLPQDILGHTAPVKLNHLHSLQICFVNRGDPSLFSRIEMPQLAEVLFNGIFYLFQSSQILDFCLKYASLANIKALSIDEWDVSPSQFFEQIFALLPHLQTLSINRFESITLRALDSIARSASAAREAFHCLTLVELDICRVQGIEPRPPHPWFLFDPKEYDLFWTLFLRFENLV
ncbi:hypothetical protein ONZ45_g9964 [Pleurotus djamor]|nr:hypothetical protein ONZ45_g9964 [Pleurotus djamor]